MESDQETPATARQPRLRSFLEGARAFAARHGWQGANRAIVLFMLLYVAAVGILCICVNRTADFRPTLYLFPFTATFALLIAALAAILALRQWQGRVDEQLLFFRGGWRPADLATRLVSAAPFLLAWPFFMSGFTTMKALLNRLLPFTWDQRLMEVGRALHFGRQPWQWLDIRSPIVTLGLEAVYVFWGVLLVAVPFAVALRRPDCPHRTRFLVSALLVFILLGNLAAGAFMSAGPFWFEFTHAPDNDYAGLFAYLAQVDPNGDFSALAFQRYLWQANRLQETFLGTGISAFPSIHVAMATLYMLFAWPLGPAARLVSFLFWAAIMVGAVHLGWHYATDCYAGSLGAAAIYAAVAGVQRLWRANRAQAERGAVVELSGNLNL